MRNYKALKKDIFIFIVQNKEEHTNNLSVLSVLKNYSYLIIFLINFFNKKYFCGKN